MTSNFGSPSPRISQSRIIETEQDQDNNVELDTIFENLSLSSKNLMRSIHYSSNSKQNSIDNKNAIIESE